MKELLTVLLDEQTETSQVKVQARSIEEVFALCHCLHMTFKEHPEILEGLVILAKMAMEDDGVAKAMERSIIQVPDFEKILKEKKN